MRKRQHESRRDVAFGNAAGRGVLTLRFSILAGVWALAERS
ncbi:hypothetical protein [Lysinibacillus sp. NPDC093692]